MSACASTTSNQGHVYRMTYYTNEEQDQMRVILPTLDPLSQRFINDYGELRAQIRAVQGR